MRAQKLQKRADRCGAEQSAPETARQALRAALDGWNREQDAQAAGELLFAAANAMRLAGVDAEEALTFASKRYCAETAGAERTKRYSGRVTCSDREKRTPSNKSGGYFYDEDRSDRTGCCEH